MKRSTIAAASCLLFALIIAAPCPYAAAGGPMLKGELSENREQIMAAQRHLIGYAIGKAPAGAVVKEVFRGSTAWYNGLRQGDKLVSEKIVGGDDAVSITLTFERDGHTYGLALQAPGDYRHYLNSPEHLPANANSGAKQTNKAEPETIAQPEAVKSQAVAAALPSPDLKPQTPLTQDNQSEPASTPAPVLSGSADTNETAAAKKTMGGSDLVILIDRSGSMSTSDCPGALSRWDWCKQQTLSLSAKTRSVFPAGFQLVLFNNHLRITDKADADAIANAFQSTKPDGGTDIAGALGKELNDYWARKREGTAKPLVVVVVTDGAPNDPGALLKELVAASREIATENEIRVVFIQIGEDNQSTDYLEELDHGLLSHGGSFPIVHTASFDKVKEQGLLRAITNALTKATDGS